MTPDQERRLEEIRASPGLSGTAQQITRVDLLSIVDAQAARIKELESFAGFLVFEIQDHIKETGKTLPRDIDIAYLLLEAALNSGPPKTQG